MREEGGKGGRGGGMGGSRVGKKRDRHKTDETVLYGSSHHIHDLVIIMDAGAATDNL